ncbi:Polygalacturonase [Acorus gramineus]|uniref:Exopolygalacturonase n=1 Tax=Acorus gramineus TaxID=55184 RepID=A0AAV9ATE1_ACOGR|nr:Polygalacturonase [Acorus gramineus]
MGLNLNKLNMIQRAASLLLVLVVVFVFEAVHATEITSRAFNVVDFGAVGDGKTDSTKAIMSAWTEACNSTEGRTRLLIPQGTFFVGPVTFKGPCKGPMVVQLQGVLKASPNLADYDSDNWVVFKYIDGLVITGGGTFDGQGASAWPHNQCPKSQKCKLLPTSIKLSFVTNATVKGIQSINSKLFHMLIFGSKNINLHSLSIIAPGDSPNTDGIHISSSSDISIARSVIATGDDCVSLGSGSVNISISNVACGPGHGISVGSLGKYPGGADVSGVHVENCTLTNTTNGVRIKTWQDSNVLKARDFTFENVVMKDVYNPIIIDQRYCPYAKCNNKAPSRVEISDVSFRRISGTSASKVAVNLVCSESVPCKNIELSDIDLTYNGVKEDTTEAATATCLNVNGISSGKQNPPSCM